MLKKGQGSELGKEGQVPYSRAVQYYCIFAFSPHLLVAKSRGGWY
jgi:hypothetical protein